MSEPICGDLQPGLAGSPAYRCEKPQSHDGPHRKNGNTWIELTLNRDDVLSTLHDYGYDVPDRVADAIVALSRSETEVKAEALADFGRALADVPHDLSPKAVAVLLRASADALRGEPV